MLTRADENGELTSEVDAFITAIESVFAFGKRMAWLSSAACTRSLGANLQRSGSGAPENGAGSGERGSSPKEHPVEFRYLKVL